MRFDTQALYELLPEIYRVRDAEQDELRRPLCELVDVLAEQAVILEDDLAQLYDDEFIETCAEWVVPYIGDLIGLQGVQGPGEHGTTPRAEVANTIGYRRRKGTAAMLEQLARDVTGWPARAVEFFQLLATTQYMNHLRPQNRSWIDLRKARRLEFLGGAFEHLPPDSDLAHTLDVRRVSSRRGRYNVPNVGIFLWRLRAYSLTRSPAVPAPDGVPSHFMLDPLARDVPLYRRPETEDDVSTLATPYNVPMPISRRALDHDLERDYGRGASIFLERRDGDRLNPPSDLAQDVVVADLSEWTYVPAPNTVALDPALGRIAFHPGEEPPLLLGRFHYGFSANLGGGEYDRIKTFSADLLPVEKVANIHVDPTALPVPSISIAAALNVLPANGGSVEIIDSGRYASPGTIDATGRRIEVRAGDKQRPLLSLTGELQITGGLQDEVTLNGLLISGDRIRVPPGLGRLRLRHCTLVPGAVPNLVVESDDIELEIDQCILGPIRVDQDARVRITNSIIDATSQAGTAYTGINAGEPGGQLTIENSTVIGAVNTSALELASNCIFLSAVKALRRQEGCVRYSHVPAGSQVPRRFQCQPEGTDLSLVVFNSMAYGAPDYMQLSALASDAIRRGADDESEMGAFHDLFQPQREAYLRGRLDEYLRFGLEAGLFLAS